MFIFQKLKIIFIKFNGLHKDKYSWYVLLCANVMVPLKVDSGDLMTKTKVFKCTILVYVLNYD